MTADALPFLGGADHGPTTPATTWRTGTDGVVVAFAALAIDRFVVDPGPTAHSSGAGLEDASPEVRRAWRAVVAALAHLTPAREFWHVLTSRRPHEGGDGAVRAGWIAVGRGATVDAACDASRAGLEDLHTILAAHCDFFTVRRITDVPTLAEIVHAATDGTATALRRTRWEPPIQVETVPASKAGATHVPGALLPWPGHAAPWAPLLEAIVGLGAGQSFVVRCETGVVPPRAAVERAERDLLSVNVATLNVLGRGVDDATPVKSVMEALTAAAADRLRLLEGPCLLADAALVGPSQPVPGLAATLAATLIATSDGATLESRTGASAGDVSPVAFHTLPPDSMWMPLNPAMHPELLVSPREAVTLVRTPEPPGDERSPLPCSRARVLPLRTAPSVGTLLGDGEMRGDLQPVRLPDARRLQHVYIVGQTGTGKSTLMLNMALDDIAAGHGLTLLDPHCALTGAVLDRMPRERRDDVIVVNPADLERQVGLNPLELGSSAPAQYLARRDALIDELFDTFDALYNMREAGGPMFEQYFRAFMSLVMGTEAPSDYMPVLPMVTEVMNDQALARALATRISDSDPITATNLKAMFKTTGEHSLSNFTPYIVSKLNRFYAPAAARRTLCQSTGLDFGDIIASRKILLVELPAAHLGPDTAALIARQVIARLATEVMRRGGHSGGPPHFVYADEFHQFATERFAALLAEARKFGLGLVLAHQYTAQLIQRGERRVLDAVLGNVGTVVAFRVGVQDAELLDGVMAPRASASDIAGLPNHVAVVRSVGDLGNVPFTLRTRPPAPVSESPADVLREQSRQRYGRPTAEVDRQLRAELEALRAVSGRPD